MVAVLRPFRARTSFEFIPGATRFALAPGYHIARLWRSETHANVAQRSALRGEDAVED
jgi:hypothetical protein